MNARETMISCSKCKGRVPLNDLKADKEGKNWVCTSCYALQHPALRSIQKQGFEKPVSNIAFKSETLGKKFKYHCNACKYNFSRNAEYKGSCPYCDKINTIEKVEL